MQNRACRWGRNRDRDRNDRQSDRYDWRSQNRNNCCPEGNRRLTHKFNYRDSSRTTDNCDRFHSSVGTEDRFSHSKRSRHNRFDFRSRNSRNCTQPYGNEGGW